MTRKAAALLPAWDDADTPEWTDDQLDRAELAIGSEVVRPTNGTLMRAGVNEAFRRSEVLDLF